MTLFPSPTIAQLKRLLPQQVWSWVIPALRYDTVVWESLNNLPANFGVEKLGEIISYPGDCTPAALGLQALHAPVAAEWLRGLPMQPLPTEFQASLEKARAPEAPAIQAASAQALDLREARRQANSWNEMISLLKAATPTTLACAFGFIPDQIDLLGAILTAFPEEAEGATQSDRGIELVVHILLSNPQTPDALLEILGSLVDILPAEKRVSLLDRLAIKRPDLQPRLAGLLPESPQAVMAKSAPSVRQRVESLSSLYSSARSRRLSQQGAQEISALNQSLEEARHLQAQLAVQLALTAQRNGDSQTSLQAWQQAVGVESSQPEYRAGYLLALIDNGNLEAARHEFDSLNPELAAAWHPLYDLSAVWLQVGSGEVSGDVGRLPESHARLAKALNFLEQQSPDKNANVLFEPAYLAELAVKAALAALRLGRPRLAAHAAQLADDWLPNDPQLTLLLALCQHEAGQHDEALQTAHLAAALAPEESSYRRFLTDTLEIAGAWSEALKEREALITQQDAPGAGDWHGLAVAALRLEMPERAIQASLYALKLDENDGVATTLLAEAARLQGNSEEARQRLQEAIELAPEHPFPWLALARLQREQGESAKALETLRSAIQSGADTSEVQLALGEMYLHADAPTQALAPLQAAMAQLRRPDAWLATDLSHDGAIQERLVGQLERALVALKHSQDLSGSAWTRNQLSAQVALRLGEALTQLGRLEEALQVLEDAHQAYPSHPDLAYSFARALLAQGKTSQAISPLEAVLSRQPENASPYLDYAYCLLAQTSALQTTGRLGAKSLHIPGLWLAGDQATAAHLPKAIQSLEHALEIEPDRLEAKAMLAEVWAGQGETGKAYQALSELWESDLSRDSRWKSRLALRLGQVALQEGKGEAAVAALLDADPENPQVQKQLAEAYFAMGMHEAAYKAAQTAYNLQPGDLEFLLWFAYFALDLLEQTRGVHPNIKSEVLSAIQGATDLCPQRGDLLVFLGQMQARFGENESARHTLSKLVTESSREPALEITPGDLDRAAQSLLELGDYAMATICLENALHALDDDLAAGHTPQDPEEPARYDLLTSLARAYRKTGDLAAAMQACDQALALEPSRSEHYLEKADLLLQSASTGMDGGKPFPEALQSVAAWLEGAIERIPDNPVLLFSTAQLLRLAGDLPRALGYALQLLEKRRAEEPASVNAQIYPNLAETATLAAELMRALLRPAHAWKLLEMAENEISAATQNAAKGTALGEYQLAYRCLHAELALEAGQDSLAANDLAVLLETPAALPRALATQARLAMRRNNLENAAELFKSARERFAIAQETGDATPVPPRSLQEIREYFTELASQRSFAHAALELSEWEDALPALERQASMTSQEPSAHLDFAWALTLRAERQAHFYDSLSLTHLPGPGALSPEAHQAFMDAWQAADELVAQNPGAASSEGEALLKRCQARGAAAFQPSQETAHLFAGIERQPADAAAHIACLRAIGDLAEASLVAREHPQHPLVLLQLAQALSFEKPRQALVAAQTAVDLLRSYEDASPESNEAPAIPGAAQWLPLAYALEAMLAKATGNRAGDASVALTAIHKALELWPDEPRWHHLAGEIYLIQDETAELPDPSAAAMHFQQALALEPGNPAHYTALGKLHLKDKEYRPAIDNFERAARLSPADAAVWQLLARAYTEKGDIQQAALAADRAVNLQPGAASPTLLRAEIAIKGGDYSRAETDLRKVLAENPADNAALLVLAKALAAQDKHAQALELLDNAIRDETSNVPVEVERARLIKKTKSPDEAIQSLQAVINRDPEAIEPYAVLAEILEEHGRGGDALSLAQRALSLKNGFESELAWEDASRLHGLMGRLYHQNGGLEAAIQHLNEAIRLAPKQVEAYLELGKVYNERRQHGLALDVYRKAITAAPDDPRAYYQAGLIYKEGKDYAEAERLLRLAARLAPDDLSVQRHLGAIVALNLVHNRSL